MGNSLDEQLEKLLHDILYTFASGINQRVMTDKELLESQTDRIKQAFKNAGYEKKHQILYGTNYPACTDSIHFTYSDGTCSCGYIRKQLVKEMHESYKRKVESLDA